MVNWPLIDKTGNKTLFPNIEPWTYKMNENWIRACAADDIDEEDLLRFDHADQTWCIYNTPEGFFATDGMCTHEDEHLENGFVIDCVVECPLHQGRFDVRDGKALSAPVCVDLKTWPVKLEDGEIYINVATD